MHYLTERCLCRFGILLEKEENGDVFGGGREEALFLLITVQSHARAAVTSVSLEQEKVTKINSIVPLYHSTVTELNATVTSVSLEQENENENNKLDCPALSQYGYQARRYSNFLLRLNKRGIGAGNEETPKTE
jgi:thioredoxin reductase